MKNKTISLVMAAILGASAWTTSVQAATFSSLQPYLTDYKIGFTNGSKLVTQAQYDEFHFHPTGIIVTKGGKKGILDPRTGKEITPVTWDDIEIPNSQSIAIVKKGGWFQYIDLKTHKLSSLKFAGAHPYDLAVGQGTAIMLQGKTSMLLNTEGKVLIPPFAGKLTMVRLIAPDQTDNKDAKSTIYFVSTTSKGLSMYDPAVGKQLFTLAKAELIPNEGGPDAAYLKVRSGGKEGLIDRNGKYVLAPQYNAIYIWNNGYYQVIGPKGQGLWKDGRMLAEPVHQEVGIEFINPDVYFTTNGNVTTYHSVSKGTSHALKKGAEFLNREYVLGQDPQTNLYGVSKIGGEVVIPFAYLKVDGPPAARTLVRSDGKKGLLPEWSKDIEEPQFWFDSYVTLGTYGMLSIKDGNKIGLYSEKDGLLLPPIENRVIRYENTTGDVVVTEPDGKVQRYSLSGKQPDTGGQKPLSEHLSEVYQPGKGTMLVNRETNEPISKHYLSVYREQDAEIIVGVDRDWADLYTAEGKLLTTDTKVAQSGNDGPPVKLIKTADSLYTMGVKAGTAGGAMIKISDDESQVLSDFVYRDVSEVMLQNQKLAVTVRTDGTMDIWAQEGNQLKKKLTGMKGFHTEPGFDSVLVQSGTGWDVYSPGLQRLSMGEYQSVKFLPLSDRQSGAFAYQDKKTGMYGLMSADGKMLTGAKYESISPTDRVFSQWGNKTNSQPPLVFTSKDHFGYLDQAGQELFSTRFLTKKPAISYRPITFEAFHAYAEVMKRDPLALVDFGKPYSWPAGGDSESKFFANLAIYLNLPKESGKQAVIAELVSKGIIKADESRTVMRDEDMYRLAYFMTTGKASQAMTDQQVVEWAQKRGIVPERGGMSYYMTMDLYAEYQHIFMTELFRSMKGKKVIKPKQLSATTLTSVQEEMLTTMLLVNGKPADQLPVPLLQAEGQKAMQSLVNQYNKQAAQLLAAYEAKL